MAGLRLTGWGKKILSYSILTCPGLGIIVRPLDEVYDNYSSISRVENGFYPTMSVMGSISLKRIWRSARAVVTRDMDSAFSSAFSEDMEPVRNYTERPVPTSSRLTDPRVWIHKDMSTLAKKRTPSPPR
jgi:hypothetical protein